MAYFQVCPSCFYVRLLLMKLWALENRVGCFRVDIGLKELVKRIALPEVSPVCPRHTGQAYIQCVQCI